MKPPSLERSHQLCAFCPSLCRFACPVEEVTGRESASPRFMSSLGHHLARGVLTWGPEVAAAVTACDGCGACVEICEHDVPIPEVLEGLRAEAHDRDLAPAAAGQVAENLATGLGPRGRFLDRALREPRPERLGAKAAVLLWPSDRSLESGPEELAATCDFLDALGIDYALPPPEAMVPSPRWARTIGATRLEKDLFKRMRAACKGYETVVYEDPEDLEVGAHKKAEGKRLWEMAPPPGLEVRAPTRFYLGPRREDPSLDGLGGALGLEPLTAPGGLRLSPGPAGLLDLLRPALSEALRARALERAAGEGVLLATPYLATAWEAGGGRARRVGDLRPRVGS
jgi:ferredoxin